MKRRGFHSLGFANIDIDRGRRCGFEEVIYAPGKTLDQLKKICSLFVKARKRLLLTRLEETDYEKLRVVLPRLKFSPIARVAFFLPRGIRIARKKSAHVLIVSAGTSDMAVSEEARVTLKALGIPVRKLYDVGVAGIQRLLSNKYKLRQASCIIVVAGMDAALASAVCGLVKGPVIAVPTSCGYGSHFKGLASLLAMLNSCSAGLGVVNIDNGFGAAILAAKILRV